MRGEQMKQKRILHCGMGPSPRTRRTVSVTWHLTNDKQLFLQLPEKQTNQTPRPQRPTLATKHTPHPEAPPPTPTGLQHSGSVRPPRIRQRSTSTQRFVQRTPPHTSRTQVLITPDTASSPTKPKATNRLRPRHPGKRNSQQCDGQHLRVAGLGTMPRP